MTHRFAETYIRVLQHPYAAYSLRPAGPLPLGAVLVLDMSGAESALEQAIIWQASAPWCPLALVIRNVPASASLIKHLTHLHDPLAFVPGASGGQFPLVEEIIKAVRNRGGPDGGEAFTYVANRLEQGSLRSLFAEAEAFTRPEHTHPAPRHVSRRLRVLGALGVPDWRSLFQLARLSGVGRVPIEELARRHGVGVRTFRAQVQRYTGVSTQSFREWLGWEWVLEAALRRWGYLDKRPALKMAKPA